MTASSLRGQIAAYFLTESKGEVVTLRELCAKMGVRYADEEARGRVRNAVRAIYRDGESGGPVKLKVVIRAQAWQMLGYVKSDPGPQEPHDGGPAADVEPGPFREEDFVEAPRPEPEPEPADKHRCPFEVIGQTEYGTIVLRNTAGKIYKAVAVE